MLSLTFGLESVTLSTFELFPSELKTNTQGKEKTPNNAMKNDYPSCHVDTS